MRFPIFKLSFTSFMLLGALWVMSGYDVLGLLSLLALASALIAAAMEKDGLDRNSNEMTGIR